MFTGLVRATGRVHAATPSPTGARLEIDFGTWDYRPNLGDSVCVSGCCLTVAGVAPPVHAFDVVPQTLATTTLGAWSPGRAVNLEHASTPTTLLGGHLVQGHVDGVGTVQSVDRHDGVRLRMRCPPGFGRWLVPKGSIAVDGVSLTLAAVNSREEWFEVALIPATLAATTLGALRPGDACNLEADVIAKTVVHYLRAFTGGRAGPRDESEAGPPA